ncbi:hypothetical protein LTS18_002082, partial [Coniosporium uncinatum]
MPEVHPAVSGFEMMLRFLFPVWDVFALYGRPNRLIADVLDSRGLMFALPKDRRYGYLEILDVAGLIHTPGSQGWSEHQWRNEMKKLTSSRMNSAPMEGRRSSSRATPRRNISSRSSLPGSRNGVQFNEVGEIRSNPGTRDVSPTPAGTFEPPKRTDSAPPTAQAHGHRRAASDATGFSRTPVQDSPLRAEYDAPPVVPPHRHNVFGGQHRSRTSLDNYDSDGTPEPETALDRHELPEVEA